jgi:hypothetical protein
MAKLRAGFVLAVMAVLAGCVTTYPTQAVLDPARFENDAVRVEWAAGASFFRMKLSNLTDAPLIVDMARSAVISVDGEARALAAVTRRDVTAIPPRSYVILASEQGVVYGTDIFGRFNQEPEDRYPLPGSSADDRIFLRAHIGETVRLYLAAEVRGKNAAYDIAFRITGASRVGAKAEAAPAAQPAVQPAVQPAPKGKM